MRQFSLVLSVVFNPLLIGTYLFWTFTFVYPEIFWPYSQKQHLWLFGIFAIGTLIMPAVSLVFLRTTGYISGFEIEDRKQRPIPFFFITFWHVVVSYLFIAKLSLGWHMTIIMFTTTFLIALLTLITFRFKISIHSAGIWGAAGYLSAIIVRGHQREVLLPLIIVFLIAGAVGTARLYLNRHTLKEVAYGALLGFAISFLSLYVYW
ncbi:MAG: hypothetical protein WBA74_20900 [Cyclobacteriaceae bacterium]